MKTLNMDVLVRYTHFLIYITIICSFVGCDPSNTRKPSNETLTFNVDHTLLEPVIADLELNITMAAPKNWKMIDNSMLTEVVNKTDLRITQDHKLTPYMIFVNKESHAMCLISKINDVNISLDENFLQTLTASYQKQFPKATVKHGIFMKDIIQIFQLLVVTVDTVLIKLICVPPNTSVFEVDYYLPKDVYQKQLRAIESSIGSIKLIH
jgi:hypothetical protein